MTALGLDIGTSAVKGLLLGADGRVIATSRRSYRLDLPAPGRVELSAERVWRATATVIATLASAPWPRAVPGTTSSWSTPRVKR
jgi:sugar (pentulose or hexulose) kinase